GPRKVGGRVERGRGAVVRLRMEAVEQTGRTGVHDLADFNRQQLLSLDSCMECGRCEDACPATATGKPLSPRAVVIDLRNLMSSDGEDVHRTIRDETLWACTMCQACVQECPVLIGHVDLISDMRRDLIAEGELSGPPAKSLQQIASQSNPYGRSNSDRLAWAEGLEVPTA